MLDTYYYILVSHTCTRLTPPLVFHPNRLVVVPSLTISTLLPHQRKVELLFGRQ